MVHTNSSLMDRTNMLIHLHHCTGGDEGSEGSVKVDGS